MSQLPDNFPNPNQENVYYSFKALSDRIGTLFPQENKNILKEKVSKYYFPTFVFDTSNAPNSYSLDIYPRIGEQSTYVLDNNGLIKSKQVGGDQAGLISNSFDHSKLKLDKAKPAELQASFYSNSDLKRAEAVIDPPVDKETVPSIDLLVGSRFYWDKQYVARVKEHLETTKRIVANTIQALPDEELTALKENLANIEKQIDSLITTLSLIKEGQSTSIDSLKYLNLNDVYHNPLSAEFDMELIRLGFDGLKGTRLNLLQSIWDLCLSGYHENGAVFQAPTQRVGEPEYVDSLLHRKGPGELENLLSRGAVTLQGIYNNAIKQLVSLGKIENSDLEVDAIRFGSSGDLIDGTKIVKSNISVLPSRIISTIVKFSHKGTEKDIFEGSWIEDWYYDNFAKRILEQETDFVALNEFVKAFEELALDAKSIAKKYELGGGLLLVKQSLMKSIRKLCQNNVDVSEYAPSLMTPSREGEDFFLAIGRPSSLGPVGCHQQPSKYAVGSDENSYQIDPFTKPGFLNYHAILEIIRTIGDPHLQDKHEFFTDFGGTSERGAVKGGKGGTSSDDKKNEASIVSYIKSQIKKYDSNHSDAVLLWNRTNKAWGGQKGIKYVNRSGVYVESNANLKELLHLFKEGETFNFNKEITLIPLGDDIIPASERTFINYNQPYIRYVLEAVYLADQSTNADSSVKPLSRTNSSSVTAVTSGYPVTGGLYQPDKAPDAYKLMGYSQNQDTNVDQTQIFSRTDPVHFGVWDETKERYGVKPENKDALQFYAQKNFNLPYYWASIVSLCRGLVVETYKFLFESIKETLGVEFEISQDEIITKFDTGKVWDALSELALELIDSDGVKLAAWGGPNGTMTFTSGAVLQQIVHYTSKSRRNTTGDLTNKMIKSYIGFCSLISDNKTVKITEGFEPVEFQYERYVPPELLALQINPNFKNGHGGAGPYIDPESFVKYGDQLTYTKYELKNGVLLNKSDGPLGTQEHNKLLSVYEQDWLRATSGKWGHTLMHEKLIEGFRNFESFINGFELREEFKEVFQDGHFDVTTDIRDPEQLIKQIVHKRKLYQEMSHSHISRIWEKHNIFNHLGNLHKEIDLRYVYILGIKNELFRETGFVEVWPEYIGSGSKIFEIDSAKKTFQEFEPDDPEEIEFRTPAAAWDEIMSKDILDYFHLARGIRCELACFNPRSDSIYDPLIVESEAGIFPWTKDDFEKNIPKKPEKIDSLYEMSPLIFPRNYFYNVCLEDEYQRVVGVFLSAADLSNLPREKLHEKDHSSVDMIGSIRWKARPVEPKGGIV